MLMNYYLRTRNTMIIIKRDLLNKKFQLRTLNKKQLNDKCRAILYSEGTVKVQRVWWFYLFIFWYDSCDRVVVS